MNQLHLPSSVISDIVDDPTVVGSIIAEHTNDIAASLVLSPQQATHILRGYNDGFRAVFIMNATLAAFATIVSIVMIRHKNLERDDDADLRAQAEKEELERSQRIASGDTTCRNSVELVDVGAAARVSDPAMADEKV